MVQYVFFHMDTNGCLWKHIHFSYIKALKDRTWWSTLKITKECSKRITIEPLEATQPMIIGRTVKAQILIKED